MYKYEFGHIIECESKKDEEIQQIIGEVRQIISDLKGRIVKEDVWGKREFAYPINKQNNGFYMFTTMMMEPFAVVEFEKKLKLLDGSLRHILINLDKEPGYAKQVAADEGDDEKIKTRIPAKENDEEDEKEETKKTVETVKKEEKPAEEEKVVEEEKVESKEVTEKDTKVEESKPEPKEEIEEKKEDKPAEETKEEKPKEGDKDYDELLDKKLSEIL